MDMSNMKGKSLNHTELEGSRKREHLLNYQDQLRVHEKRENIDQKWKKLIHKKSNQDKEFIFKNNNLSEASNPLILMNSKQLNKDLVYNEKQCGQQLHQYINFSQDVERAIDI